MFNSRSKSVMCFLCYIASPLRFSMSTSFVRCLLWLYLFTCIFCCCCYAMEFLLLWSHCHNATRWSCGRSRINRVVEPHRRAFTWRDAIVRVLTVWEGKWFRLPLSPHPLFSPTPPQVLTPFNNVQLLTDTKTTLHCTSSLLPRSSNGFYLGNLKEMWIFAASLSYCANIAFHVQILTYALNKQDLNINVYCF